MNYLSGFRQNGSCNISQYNHTDIAMLHSDKNYIYTVYPKKYAHGFCFAVLCCGYTLTDFPISIRLTSLALWQSDDCPSASKATLMNMDKYFIWIHYERLHNHNKAKHNKTVCIFLGIYCNVIAYWRVMVDRCQIDIGCKCLTKDWKPTVFTALHVDPHFLHNAVPRIGCMKAFKRWFAAFNVDWPYACRLY